MSVELFTDAWGQRVEAPRMDAATVGYIGLDTPVELVVAAGFRPLRVIAAPSTTAVEQYAEGLGHPLLRGLGGALIEGPYRDLKHLIIAPTPGAYGFLYVFLRELKHAGRLPAMELHLFDLNHGTAPQMRAQRRSAVAALKETLEAWSRGPITEGDLAGAITLENSRRTQLRMLARLRKEGRVSGLDALAIHGAREGMEPKAYAGALAGVLEERLSSPVLTGTPTLYSGGETVGPGKYEELEAAGMLIVADDQDGGSRSVGPDVAMQGDLLAALAERYVNRDPAPAKSAVEARAAYLVDLAKSQGATQAVFAIDAFDHPPAWELPVIREALAFNGVEARVMGEELV